MHFVFRTVSRATLRRSFLSPLVPPANSLSIGKQLCIRLSSTGRKSKSEFSSLNPLPTPPPPPKGRPLIINTHDIEQYVQPLYARGWELSGIGNSIAVLRKRFEFADAEALEGFLADLSEYEEKKKHHAKTDVFDGQNAVLVSTWTHVARRSDGKVEDKGEKTQGVTARDIRLAYALEELFESALAAGGRE